VPSATWGRTICFQLLSLVAMEPPSRFDVRAVRSEKAEALDAVRVPEEAAALRDSVRAQYAAARIGDNESRIIAKLQT
jgi:glucose-6-phosphate 1-dehydrogenase